MLIGHSHQVFPDKNSTVTQFNLPGVDKVKGTVNGMPTVMANFWGKHLGVIELALANEYRFGATRPHDDALELQWLTRAANAELPEASLALAMAYRNGELGIA